MSTDLGRMLAEAEMRLHALKREMAVCEAQIRTLATEVLAEGARPAAVNQLRVAPYARPGTTQERAEEAYRLNHSRTFAWNPAYVETEAEIARHATLGGGEGA